MILVTARPRSPFAIRNEIGTRGLLNEEALSFSETVTWERKPVLHFCQSFRCHRAAEDSLWATRDARPAKAYRVKGLRGFALAVSVTEAGACKNCGHSTFASRHYRHEMKPAQRRARFNLGLQ